jgi:hypothetical protein
MSMSGEPGKAPFNVPSWSKAYLRGDLDEIETNELRHALSSGEWHRLQRRRYVVINSAKIRAILTKPENTLNDVCQLMAMLLEQP